MSEVVRRLQRGLWWIFVGMVGCVMLLWYLCKWTMWPDSVDEVEKK